MKCSLVFCVFCFILSTVYGCPCNDTSISPSTTEPSKMKPRQHHHHQQHHHHHHSGSCPLNCMKCHGQTCKKCHPGWFGKDCSKPCSQCPDRCCQKMGHCLSCPDGKFGVNCTVSCPISCKADNGTVRCKTMGGQCTSGCEDGYYGDRCTLPCGHCRNGKCSQSEGLCETGCDDGYYGKTCQLTCGFCRKGACSQGTGVCELGCKAGYYGASCELLCENCACRNCSQHTGQCYTGCPDNGHNTFHSSKFDSPLVSSIMTTTARTCPPNCLHCDRDGCTMCRTGWFGVDCSIACSMCPGNCSQTTGHCLSCQDGTFGDNCTETCPRKCKPDSDSKVTCDTMNGECSNGCVDGYYGDTCTMPCGQCKSGTCAQITGQCENGCEDGYYGEMCKLTCGSCSTGNCSQSSGLCENGCNTGYYGASCGLLCNNCPCGNCSQHTGHCDMSCQDSNGSKLFTTNSGITPDNTQQVREAEDVIVPLTPGEANVVSNRSALDPALLKQSETSGSSQKTVDTAVGVTFALLFIVICVCIAMCGKYRKIFNCDMRRRRRSEGSEERSEQDTNLYAEDDVGSPKLVRNNERSEEYQMVPTSAPVDDKTEK